MGISPGGAMTGADIVVGWFKDGEPMITVKINDFLHYLFNFYIYNFF